MKNIPVIIVAFMLMILNGCLKDTSTKKDANLESVDAKAAYQIIQNNLNNPDFIIVDVRTPEEYSEGHINNSININYTSDKFGDQVKSLNRNKEYIIYCRSGRRSAEALKVFKDLGFKKIYNIKEGIVSWTSSGLPVSK